VAPKSGFERKHFFIDRSFQGRYMITFLIPMLIMLLFLLFTLYFASQSIIKTTTDIIRDNIEITIASQLQDKPNPTVDLYKAVISDIGTQLRSFSSDVKYRHALITSLLWVFGAGLAVVIAEIVVLTIFFSHKVAGPVYRFERVCHGVIDGNYTEAIKLRKGDDLQNLARLLDSVVQLSRQRIVALRDEQDKQKRDEITSALKL
jgi:hypothetical protein